MSDTLPPLPEKAPYEVLIRFDPFGAVLGAHVIWQYPRYVDGQIRRDFSDAKPAGENGADFPLSAAVGEALAQGLERAAPILAQVPAMLSANQALTARVAELEAAQAPASEAA